VTAGASASEIAARSSISESSCSELISSFTVI
jgi:hypothetical protein